MVNYHSLISQMTPTPCEQTSYMDCPPGHRQKRAQAEGDRDQAAQGEHCRVQTELRDHGRRRAGFLEGGRDRL